MSLSFDLSGKKFIVTGASSGIGRAVSIAAARAGAIVILVARNQDRLEETAAFCDGRPVIEPCDLTELDKLPRFMMGLAKKHGPLSGLVHCAGVEDTRPLKTIRGANLIDTFTVNCAAAVMLVKGLSAHGCFNANGTSVVLLSSVSGTVGVPGQISYCASKGALELAAKSMAIELIPLKIRVNTVAPAMIETPMHNHGTLGALAGSELSRQIEANHPSGFGTVEDVASGVIYLLSDASRYVVGATLAIDGGYCAK